MSEHGRQLGLREQGWQSGEPTIPGVPFYYVVTGLPDDHLAKVAFFDHRWQILRRVGDEVGEWTGHHDSKEAALAVIQAEWGRL